MHSQNEPEKPGPSKINLCLSGGGFRATFFHLGVVKLLAETGWLQRVHSVYSVSGGSVLAAHMAVNWEAYTSGDDRKFRQVTSELIEFGRMDLRGRILRNWIPFIRGRTSILEKNLDKLLNGKKLGELPTTPDFNFLATSLTSGSLCSFSRQAWIVVSLAHHGPSYRTDAKSLPLSRVVAASAAFPPLFTPVKMKAEGFVNEHELPYATTHYLTDGGIYDNLGLAHIKVIFDNFGVGPRDGDTPIVQSGFSKDPFAPTPKSLSCVVSDASAVFDHINPKKFQLTLSRTARSFEIIMTRLAERDIQHAYSELDETNRQQDEEGRHKDQERWFKHISIKDKIDWFQLDSGKTYKTQSALIQNGVKFVRTDLDRFDPLLMKYLVNHGHEVAANSFHLEGPKTVFRESPWKLDFPEDRMKDPGKLEKYLDTQKDMLRKKNLFGLKDIPIIVWLICIVAVLVIVDKYLP